MSYLNADVCVFAPALPFKKTACKSPGIDTWHEDVLISKELRDKLPHVKNAGVRRLRVSGGVSMSVQSVEIGLQIGDIQISKIRALVVDEGTHDILLGSDIFGQIFSASRQAQPGQRGGTPEDSNSR